MEYTSDITEEELGVNESILLVLLREARLSDARRIFAGLRRPSKLHRGLLQDLCDIRTRRSDFNKALK